MTLGGLLIVGDRFKGFAADKPNVVTVSEFRRLAHDGKIANGTHVLIGQGVGHDSFEGVIAKLQRHHISVVVGNPDQIVDQVDYEHQSTVHKTNPENILISRPRDRGDGTFISWLSIQDQNELLLDHVTGQHIQGMILTEAARQMFLSVSEHYLLESEQRGKCYFVINSLNTQFLRFAFPTPTSVIFRTETEERRSGKSLRVKCTIEFYQAHEVDQCVASVITDYTAFDASYIAQKEAVNAISTLAIIKGAVVSAASPVIVQVPSVAG
ncbi:AfsA-related hotdog domain-containing protein [Methylobacterium radiotolerans]|uniref:AfsA-related hotdog domain-containing protein n=1 Tax=Methylobacterium radiotolerans TaxID=31998 RepID=UPI0009FA477F|nr:AfsA-related hotdog domain-containing protein [Methylobacterium radiotolerans]